MQDRGSHATGITGITKKGAITAKQAMPADKFINTEGFNNILKQNPSIIIGHTRYATVGDKALDENAHPFQIGNIVGAHNGSVFNHSLIYPEGKVDSEAIFYNLNKYNNDYVKAFEELRGKFAITWVDINKPNKVFLALDGSPLHIMKINEIDTYFWASTDDALKSVLGGLFDLTKAPLWQPKTEHTYILDNKMQVNKKKIAFKSYEYTGHYSSANKEVAQTLAEVDADEEEDYNSTYEHTNGEGFHSTGIRSYMERTGYQNPFVNSLVKSKLLLESGAIDEKKEGDSVSIISNHAEVMDLDMPTMQLIIHLAIQQGCVCCEKDIDLEVETGVFYLKTDKSILCLKCQNDLQEPMHRLIWIDREQYERIYEEVADREFVSHEEELALNEERRFFLKGGKSIK